MTAGTIEAGLQRTLHLNPCVTMHELRLRMRGWRPFAIMLSYTAVACGAVVLGLLPAFMGTPRSFSAGYGRPAFTALAFAQLSLILLLLPAYAAGSISLEREKRTLEMLRATLVTPSDVVTGKLLVVLAFGLMLLITSLPIAAWCLLLGGVAPEEVLYVHAYLFAVASAVSALGMAYSARMSRSVGAVVATYGTIIAVSVLASFTLYLSLRMFWHRGTSGAITPMGAFAASFVVALISGWGVYACVKAAVGRFARVRAMAVTLALVAALGVVLALTRSGGSLSGSLGSLRSTAFATINPYLGLSVLLYSDVAAHIMYPGAPLAPLTSASTFDRFAWCFASSLYLLSAAALYALAIRSFARRPD